MRVTLIQAESDRTITLDQRIAMACDQVAACHGDDLVVLPELWLTGYFNFDDYAATAQAIPGPASRALGESARAANAYVHGGSLVERSADGRCYNTSLMFGPDGEIVASYRKIHLFGYDSRESALLADGDAVAVCRLPIGRIGLATCYDLRFPELFRALVDDGAQVLLVVASWPQARVGHWRLLLQARAVENQALVIGVNAAGRQDDVVLAGHSMVIDPWGTIIATAGSAPERLSVDVDLADIAAARATFPALADRRFPTSSCPRRHPGR